MLELLEREYSCTIREWGIPIDENTEAWSAVAGGELIRAYSLALLLSALQDRSHRPLLLAA